MPFFDTIKTTFKTPGLRNKVLYTLFILLIFRLGSHITAPFVNATSLLASMGDSSNTFFGYLNMMSGGAFDRATIFALSITPYINSSIIIQLLTVSIPYLERLAKDAGEGRKKLARITRYTTVILALVQAIGYFVLLKNYNCFDAAYVDGPIIWFTGLVVVLTFTAGAALIMWLGEQINEKGVGNGISIILFAGIVARGPSAVSVLIENFKQGSTNGIYYFLVPLTIVMFAAMIVFIIIMTLAERRIPVMYAKRVVGRKMYGGQSSYIPIKVSMSGVMPIIFASAILSLPSTIALFWQPEANSIGAAVLGAFTHTGWVYAVLYFLLIILFNYFYIAIQYNPVEIANNIKSNNGAIPGIRPGKPTVNFISRVISKVTLIGAFFLGVIAVFPILYSGITNINVSLGGTSIIIVVGVALDTMRQLESQLTMRHHKGFLE